MQKAHNLNENASPLYGEAFCFYILAPINASAAAESIR